MQQKEEKIAGHTAKHIAGHTAEHTTERNAEYNDCLLYTSPSPRDS